MDEKTTYRKRMTTEECPEALPSAKFATMNAELGSEFTALAVKLYEAILKTAVQSLAEEIQKIIAAGWLMPTEPTIEELAAAERLIEGTDGRG